MVQRELQSLRGRGILTSSQCSFHFSCSIWEPLLKFLVSRRWLSGPACCSSRTRDWISLAVCILICKLYNRIVLVHVFHMERNIVCTCFRLCELRHSLDYDFSLVVSILQTDSRNRDDGRYIFLYETITGSRIDIIPTQVWSWSIPKFLLYHPRCIVVSSVLIYSFVDRNQYMTESQETQDKHFHLSVNFDLLYNL